MAITQLTLTATPGRRYATFTVKRPGPFTALSLMATPGRRHVFYAKTPAPVVVEEARRPRRHGPKWYSWQELIAIDDAEVMELLPIFLDVIDE